MTASGWRASERGADVEARVSFAVLVVASTWFALAAAWEMFGPLLAGHYASSASVGIIAENMLRFRIAGPVWEYTASKPSPEAYYCHHPWGIFWSTAIAMKLLGRHDFVCRIVPVCLSAATPLLLYALARRIWRPAAGAAAACAFVVLPIALAFANFNALEVPVMAYGLLALYGYVRFTETAQRRHLALAVVGLSLALHADWPSFLLAGGLLAFTAARSLFLRGVFGPLGPTGAGVPTAVRERRFALFWILSAASTAATLGLYLALFHRSGKLGDLLASYSQRSHGGGTPLAKVLHDRRYWIELSFTPVAIFLGKAMAVVSLVRLAVLRREHDVIPLLVLGMSVVQYVVFKQGADIHVFWPHTFAAYFALAMGAFVATLAGAADRLGTFFARRSGRIPSTSAAPALAALGAALLPLALVARDGIPALRYARETGGRFNEKGLVIDSDGDKTAFLRFVAARVPAGAAIEMHEGMKSTWAQTWTLGGRPVLLNRPVPAVSRARGVYLVDTRFLRADAQEDLARRFHVVAVGPFWLVDRGEAPAPIDAFAFNETEPSWFEWYFVSGTEPRRSISPDDFRTWELRFHFGQSAILPDREPSNLEEKRIAHNAAVARNDVDAARRLLDSIQKELGPADARFEDDSEIVAARFQEGVRPLWTLMIRAGAVPSVEPGVRSKVRARAAFSTTMADPTDREVGLPMELPVSKWRPGFLYAHRVSIRKRPGTEAFRVYDKTRSRGAENASVLRLELP